MGRIEWLKWRLRYGNPKTRTQEIKFFLGFELYNLGCVLSGYRILIEFTGVNFNCVPSDVRTTGVAGLPTSSCV